MILGFSDLELAISDVNGALHYLEHVYEVLAQDEHAELTRIVERLCSIEDDLCELFERLERDDE